VTLRLNPPDRQGQLGWQLGWHLLGHDPAFGRSPGAVKALLGLLLISLLPPALRANLLDRLGSHTRWINPQSLLGYIRRPSGSN
jgi:hypothetical protein